MSGSTRRRRILSAPAEVGVAVAFTSPDRVRAVIAVVIAGWLASSTLGCLGPVDGDLAPDAGGAAPDAGVRADPADAGRPASDAGNGGEHWEVCCVGGHVTSCHCATATSCGHADGWRACPDGACAWLFEGGQCR